MNIKLLKRVRDRIAARPRQFVMRALFDTLTESKEKVSHCGTAACIAGWTYTLLKRTTPKKAEESGDSDCGDEYVTAWVTAEKALDITREQAMRLFWSHHWPLPFKWDFAQTMDADEHAKIAVARINHFIKTKGAE